MPDAGCAGPCRAGYFCPEGSTSAAQHECGSTVVYCPAGASGPLNVTAGWYATGGGGLTRTGQEACGAALDPDDHAVGTAPSGRVVVPRCPDNTVGWNGTALVRD